MFNIGFTELIVIAAIALIFIGPKQLPDVARTVGRFLNELRRASDEALQVFKETQTKSQDFINKTTEEIMNVEKHVDPPVDTKTEVVSDKSTEDKPS